MKTSDCMLACLFLPTLFVMVLVIYVLCVEATHDNSIQSVYRSGNQIIVTKCRSDYTVDFLSFDINNTTVKWNTNISGEDKIEKNGDHTTIYVFRTKIK
jgi:hypothetical protein